MSINVPKFYVKYKHIKKALCILKTLRDKVKNLVVVRI